MLVLSDSQIAQIALVARPLRPAERVTFMAALFQDLIMRREVGEVGDGELGRTLRELQRKYFVPPTDREISATRNGCY
jgi:hypothetical protein